MRDLQPFTGELPYFPDGRPVAPAAITIVPTFPPPARRLTIMFCWDLGAGRGHLMQMLVLAQGLAAAGHLVLVAFRDLDRAGPIYLRAGVSFLPAPAWLSGPALFARPITYAQMLANCGFGNDAALFARACAWRTLFEAFTPDLVIVDHSPTALLALRGLPIRRALIGSGFCCPPDDERDGAPWAIVRPEEAAAFGFERLREDDTQVLARCNRVLGKWRQPPLERLGQLYSEVDENFLTTFPELDHFPIRGTGGQAASGTGYWGPVITEAPGGEPPQWPDASGKRAFVYLKDPAATEATLTALVESKQPTVAFIDGGSAEVRQKFESPTMHLTLRPLDLRRTAAECDLAVLGGGHGATIEMLLAGKPVLEVPSAREQRMVADCVAGLGAGEVAQPKRPEQVREKLSLMLGSDRYRHAAEVFARRYAAFDPSRQRQAMLARCEGLIPQGWARAAG